MIHIRSLIPKFLQKEGIKKQVEEVEIRKIADIILNEVFGNNSAKASFFRNSTLQIKCSNSALANEIQLHKERIKNEINAKTGKEMVKDLLIRIG